MSKLRSERMPIKKKEEKISLAFILSAAILAIFLLTAIFALFFGDTPPLQYYGLVNHPAEEYLLFIVAIIVVIAVEVGYFRLALHLQKKKNQIMP